MAMTYGTYATPRADLGEAFHEFSPDGMTFIAEAIFPERPVPRESGTISAIKRTVLRAPDTRRANGGTFNRVGLEAKDIAYACENHGLEIPLTDTDRKKYQYDFDAEVESVQVLRLQMKLRREIRVKQLIFNTTTWTGAALYTDNSASPWDTTTTDIISQVCAAAEKVRANTGVKANALILGEAAVQNMLKNTVIQGRFPDNVLLTVELIRQQMASIFGLRYLLVGDTVYNTADEGQDFSGGDIWPDDYAMVAKIATPGMQLIEPCVARTLRWSEYITDYAGIDQYREEQTKSDIFRNEDYLQEKILDEYFAHLMKIDA